MKVTRSVDRYYLSTSIKRSYCYDDKNKFGLKTVNIKVLEDFIGTNYYYKII